MAEAISLGASVLAFIMIAAELSKAAIPIYNTMKDAPDDVQRVQSRLKDLQFILSEINNLQSNSASDRAFSQDDKAKKYWDERSTQLRADFTEFEAFASNLNETKPAGRLRWFLSRQDRTKKLLALLLEDIDVLKTLHQLMLES
jgi:hypothetical protein